MSKFLVRKLDECHKSHKGYIGGAMFDDSLQHDQQIEINHNILPDSFTAPSHYHSRSKTWVIVLKGAMHFKIEDENIVVNQGEFLIFDKNVKEEVVRVEPGTESITIHAPSIKGGDKVSK